MSSSPLKSIFDLEPLEQGGQIARSGFSFQDHVAAHLALEMIADASLREVWCETQDDVTLIWQTNPSSIEVEFVQVKSNDLNQLWTAAKVCERDKPKESQSASGKDGAGRSIIERSFANDRCLEPT